ncbi:hypothetical protein AV530_014846 [Patagioenas fasciata monilis]|uniref:Uncharacterized protein n=1 Tax=Patagioenas fasciata monilis TaxID=372326 RepID=A0A1V4L096_PATFA|nr:hypothetical protein AV530_014846 [Patagioenas fasciata monilis]
MDSLPLATQNVAVIPEDTTLCSLTTGVPGRLLLALQTVLQALLHVGFGIAPGGEDLAQKCNVCDGQPERVDFGEALLIGEDGETEGCHKYELRRPASHMEEGLNLIRLFLLGNTVAPAPTAELLVDAQKVMCL